MAQADQIRNLEHTVYGNGRPGLTTRVTIMETRIDTSVSLLKTLVVLAVPSAIALVVCAIGVVTRS